MEEQSLKQLMVDKSELDHYVKELEEIKKDITDGNYDEAIKRIDKLSEFLEDDIEYMRMFAQDFPLEEMRRITKECLENKTVPFMNDEGIFHAEYDNFVSQGPEGVLYDLNRDFATSYTLYSPRTMNDLGCAILITHLLNENKELKEKLNNKEID